MSPKIVITGMGIISRLGENFSEVMAKLKNDSEIRSSLSDNVCCEDFDPIKHLGKKKLRNLNRCTKMLLAAGKLALNDAGIIINQECEENTGVVLASNYGVDANVREMEEILYKEGVVGINPASAYIVSLNGVTSQMSIHMKAKAFNITTSSGTDAISFAKNLITTRRANVVMVGGAEDVSKKLMGDFYRQGLLAASNAASQPFRPESQGMILGDGAAVIILEESEHALLRNANVYAEVGECGLTYYPDPGVMSAGFIADAIKKIIVKSGLELNDIGLIMSSANGSALDMAELNAYTGLFDADALVFNVKSFFGECFGFTNILQVAFGAYLIRQNDTKPVVNLGSIKNNRFDFCEKRFGEPFSNALINNVGLDGTAGVLLLKRA